MDDDLRVSLRRRSSPTGREESRSAYLKSESDARENTRIQNVYSGKASRVLRVLLQKPRTWNLTTLGNELPSETRVNPFVSAESDVRRRELEQSWNQIKKRSLPPLFSVAADEWAASVNPHVAERTQEIYEVALRCHLKPALGALLLCDIDANRIASSLKRLPLARSTRNYRCSGKS